MLDRLFFISLVLNASGLFRFVAPQAGVTIGQVSLALLIFNCFYLVARTEYTVPTLLQGGTGRWLVMLLLWPLFTLVYSPVFDLREIGVQIYYGTLFLGTVVFVQANGLKTMRHMLTISLIITIIGMPLSMLAPQYFEAVANLADARAVEQGRPIGFFMQPNRLATSLVFLFIGWFALWRSRTVFREILAVMVFLGLELLTGSRAGLLVGVGVVAVMLIYRWPERLLQGRLIATGALMLVCLVGGIVGTRILLASISDDVTRYGKEDLIGRIESIVTLDFSPKGSLDKDKSLEERFATQVNYLELVGEAPAVGHGFGSELYYKELGRIWLSAHSDALTTSFEYGLFYPFALCIVVCGLYLKRSRHAVEKVLDTNSIAQFVAAFLVLFAYSSVMEGRVFYIILGLVFAAVQYPERLFEGKRDQAASSSPSGQLPCVSQLDVLPQEAGCCGQPHGCTDG